MVNSSDFETDVGTMDVYARGADPVYVTAPSSLQQEDGVKPLDRLPSQWWNWFLHEATSRFANYKSYISNALAELDNLLDLSAITPDDTKTNQLKGMFENNYLQKYLPEVVFDASTFSVDAAKESSILVSNDDGNNGFDVKKVPYSPCLIYNGQSITTVKTIALPANSPYDGQCFKVVFKNGHNCADSSTPMTLNGKPVLVNVDGVLSALPIHEMTEGGATEYKSLQANTVLDIYYNANYDGNNNDGFVIIGNPVVLSSADYTIYANGKIYEYKKGTWDSGRGSYVKAGDVVSCSYEQIQTVQTGIYQLELPYPPAIDIAFLAFWGGVVIGYASCSMNSKTLRLNINTASAVYFSFTYII